MCIKEATPPLARIVLSIGVEYIVVFDIGYEIVFKICFLKANLT